MRLQSKLLLIFLSISLFLIVISSYIYYHQAKKAVTHQVLMQLASVSKIQANRLETVIDMMYERLSLVSSRTTLRELLYKNELENGEYSPQITKILKDASRPVQSFREIFVLNIQGKVIASTNPSRIGEDHAGRIHFQRGKEEQIVNNFFLTEDNNLRSYLSGPLYWEGNFVGVVVIESSLDYLLRFLEDYTGLGETGETILAQQTKKGDALFLTPLRFDTASTLKRVIPKEKIEDPVIHALMGNEQVMTDVTDYDNQEIFASTRYINRVDWGLVTKIDKAEALEPLKALKYMFILIIMITSLVITLVIIYFTRRITRPVKNLTRASARIIEGDYSERIEVETDDEIGELSIVFNKMADSLTEAKAKLDEKVKELENTNQELKEFAYIVSHDLKAPLRAIISLSDWLVEDYKEKLDEEGREQLSMMKDKVQRMQDLIDGILKFSRVGRMKGNKENIDLNNLLDEVIDMIHSPDDFTIDKKNELPVIWYEKAPVQQIFMNLISNAVKYNDKEKGKLTISSQETEDHWEFSFADNGPGIEEQHFDRVFQIFQTLEKREDSTGVGLAVVKKIIKHYGGRIWIESKKGEGADFIFTLPKKEKNEKDTSAN